MTKNEMVAGLPNGPLRAMQLMAKLDERLATLDRHLAVALNRIEEQQDAMADSLTPMLQLRDQVASALKEAQTHLQHSTAAAKHSSAMAAESERVVQERALLLVHLAEQARPALWKYGLVCTLCVGLLLGLLQLWPALAIRTTIQIDPRMSAAAIAQELARIAQEQRRAAAGR